MLGAVLGVSMVLESASLAVAIRSVREGADVAGLSFWEYVRRGIDPTSVAVMMEDAGAVAGLAVAGASHISSAVRTGWARVRYHEFALQRSCARETCPVGCVMVHSQTSFL